MKNKPELKWQKDQYLSFQKEWKEKWNNIFPEQKDLLGIILKLNYDCFCHINNAFGKIDKALQVCEFLNMLRNKKPPQDTEKIIITTLVSCAEATYRINKPKEIFCEKLVKGFFEPVKSKIRYKIRGSVGDNPRKKIFNPVEVLYLIRNDYVHNGNFTGLFFRSENSEDYAYNFGTFHFYEKKDKLKLIQANSECCLTYEQFLQIFLEAFIINIQDFYNNYSKIK